MAYIGLVAISPKTTPRAASDSCARRLFVLAFVSSFLGFSRLAFSAPSVETVLPFLLIHFFVVLRFGAVLYRSDRYEVPAQIDHLYKQSK